MDWAPGVHPRRPSEHLIAGIAGPRILNTTKEGGKESTYSKVSAIEG